MIKNKLYALFVLLFLFLFSKPLYPFSLGLALGGGFENYEKSSEISPELSGFCAKIEVLSFAQLGKRILFFPNIGAQITQDSQTLFAGTRIGWIIHPHYSPFIGGKIDYRYSPKLGEEKQISSLWISFSIGFNFLNFTQSHVWFLMDYGFFQPLPKNMASNDFTFSLAWIFHLF